MYSLIKLTVLEGNYPKATDPAHEDLLISKVIAGMDDIEHGFCPISHTVVEKEYGCVESIETYEIKDGSNWLVAFVIEGEMPSDFAHDTYLGADISSNAGVVDIYYTHDGEEKHALAEIEFLSISPESVSQYLVRPTPVNVVRLGKKKVKKTTYSTYEQVDAAHLNGDITFRSAAAFKANITMKNNG